MIPLNQIPEDARCITCRWFFQVYADDLQEKYNGDLRALVSQEEQGERFCDIIGNCLRYPPRFIDVKNPDCVDLCEANTRPEVVADSICGEWTPIPGKAKESVQNRLPTVSVAQGDVLSIPVEEIFTKASARIKKAIRRLKGELGYTRSSPLLPKNATVFDLIQKVKCEDDLMCLKEIGMASVLEIHEILAKYGLRFTWGPPLPSESD